MAESPFWNPKTETMPREELRRLQGHRLARAVERAYAGSAFHRRLFDEHTRPADAMVVDAALVDVDWDAPGVQVGKAVYRSLGEGLWVITVTANGSLDLVKSDYSSAESLVTSPPVRDYEAIEEDARTEIDKIGPGDVVRRVFFGKPAQGD